MRNSSGQALVLVLLSLAVVLTLVLYILSRSVTDIAVSSREEESVRAFSAAEAGVEKALIVGSNLSAEIGNAQYSTDVTGASAGESFFNYPVSLFSGDTSTLWFADHDANGNVYCGAGSSCFSGDTLKVCWGKTGTYADPSKVPAIEISVYYETGGAYRIVRDAIDPVNTSRTPSNSFSPADGGTCTVGDESYQYQKTFDLTSLGVSGQLQLAKIRMLYNSDAAHNVGFDVNFAGNSTLPSQGLSISSTGSAGESNRRLDVFQGWPEAPTVFDYAIYGGIGLRKDVSETPIGTPPAGTPPSCVSFSTVHINSCDSAAKATSDPRDPDCVTTSTDAVLNLASGDATTVSVAADVPFSTLCSNLADSSFGSPVAYTPAIDITLPSGTGDKKVCVKLANASGSSKCGGTIYLESP